VTLTFDLLFETLGHVAQCVECTRLFGNL